MIPITSLPVLTPAEQKGLQDYWTVYEAHRAEVRTALAASMAQRPEFTLILRSDRPEDAAVQATQTLEQQRRAVFDGDWEPYLESLRIQGRQYAQAGLEFQAWFEAVGLFRKLMRPYLLDAYRQTPERLLSAMDGVDKFIEIALGNIGASYLETKQDEIRKHEDALQQSERKFSRIFEKAAFASALSRLSDGQIIDINEAWTRISGYTRAEMVGKTTLELGINPDAELRKRMLTELKRNGSLHDQEVTLRMKSGEVRLLSLNIDMIEIDGEKCILNTALDITERKRSEDELLRQQQRAQAAESRAQTEARFRGLLEAAPDSMVVVNEKGIIQIINSQTEQLFGYARAELVGQPVEMLVPEDLRSGHTAHRTGYAQHPIARPMGTGLELHGRRRDGTEFPVEISLSPLETDQGRLVTAAIRDVTDRMQTEREISELNAALERRATELEVANRELEAFSYSVSHDLRAPLRTIDGFSQALLEDYSDQLPPDARNFLERVRGAAQRMAKLIDDLLELSRISRTPVERKLVDISALAASIAAELQEADPGRNAEFTIEPGLEAQGDERLLRIVLQNLLNNAWKFTSKVEHTLIEVGKTGASRPAAFFVRDNGAGFDMAYASKLFGAFQRLHAVSEFPGTGIGLATVQRIVHKHGGRIWAESVVEQGATFHFTLQPEEAQWRTS